MGDANSIQGLTAHLFRQQHGKMVAVLCGLFGMEQLDAVTDAVQDSFEAALLRWRYTGIPEKPEAWLMQVAKNKLINTLKRDAKTQALSSDWEQQVDDTISITTDASELRLFFACCHTDFSQQVQVLITLHLLCGFGVPELANALQLQNETVKKALTRAKSKLKELPNIVTAALTEQDAKQAETMQLILYLLFNEGYSTTRKADLINHGLCFEAMRLAKLLGQHPMVNKADNNALLALFFYNTSRFETRQHETGRWLTLEEQDRNRWNKVLLAEAQQYLQEATNTDEVSRYHIEAVIASLHSVAPNFAATNWIAIAQQYRYLEMMEPASVMIKVNRFMAESYVHGTAAAMEGLIRLEQSQNFWVMAALADMYRRSEQWHQARLYYQKAIVLSDSPANRGMMEHQLGLLPVV